MKKYKKIFFKISLYRKFKLEFLKSIREKIQIVEFRKVQNQKKCRQKRYKRKLQQKI